MKNINVLLASALLVVVAILITVLFMKKVEAGSEHYMNCESVGTGSQQMNRCVNNEVICYTLFNNSISCLKK